MTHRGPFQPRTFCDSVKGDKWGKDKEKAEWPQLGWAAGSRAAGDPRGGAG